MKKTKRPHLAVRAVIANEEGKVLILKRAKTEYGEGRWCLPGGNVEYGESADESMAKEIRQETSLITNEIKYLFYTENLPSDESDLHYVNLVFHCITGGNLRLNYESSEYAWIDLDDIHNYIMAFKNDLILKRYRNLTM